MFQQQPAAGVQVFGRAFDQGQQIAQAVAAGRQGAEGFVAQRRQMRVFTRDVRRVADDQLKALARQGLPPVAQVELQREAQPAGIFLRHCQGRGAEVQGMDLGGRVAGLQGQGDGTAAGA